MDSLKNARTYLAQLGFFPQHSGFGYLACAIELMREEPMEFYCKGMSIVETVADDCGIASDCVRRCMRYSLSTAWLAPGNSGLRAIFPDCSDCFPPPLHEFICRAALDLDARQRR